MKKKYSDTCLIKIQKGDKIQRIEDGKIGEVVDFNLSPNGLDQKEIVSIIVVKFDDGRVCSATSDKFSAIKEEYYDEFFPTVNMLKQIDKDEQ